MNLFCLSIGDRTPECGATYVNLLGFSIGDKACEPAYRYLLGFSKGDKVNAAFNGGGTSIGTKPLGLFATQHAGKQLGEHRREHHPGQLPATGRGG